MLFQVVKGSINDIDNLEIRCEEAFVMDFGDSTFTSFEASNDWLTFFERFPQVDPTRTRTEEDKTWYIGKIHSHHNMSAFHSGVDTQDLLENAPKLPFFLSLVVNYSCNPFAEIAVAGEVEEKSVTRSRWSLKGLLKTDTKINKKEDKKAVALVIPCEVMYLTEQWILDQIKVVRDRNIKPTYYTSPYFNKDKDEKKDEKVGAKIHNPKGYRLVLEHLAELLTLGCGTMTTNNQPPALAYDYVDNMLNVNNKGDYLTAIKNYFVNEWFAEHFEATNLEATEVLDCLRAFLKQDSVKNMWLTTDFNKTINELENEIKLLRPIQRHLVVQSD